MSDATLPPTPLPTAIPRSAIDRRTEQAAYRHFAGGRRGALSFLPFVGPAVVASVAYVDPGNFATNIQGGAAFGYELLWVVVLANLVAMLFQGLSARLGIVTGLNLAELCREHFPRPLVLAMWVASEIAAMATDLAEFLGASIGLSLLLGLPLLVAMVITGIAVWAILMLDAYGFRPLELVIGGLIGVISLSYLVEMLIAPLDWAAIGLHSFLPQLSGPDSVTLAVGIVGATVMPHAIYLHSSLTQQRIRPRDAEERRRLIRASDREVIVALSIAGLVNMAMLAMAASVFHDGTHDNIATIQEAYRTLTPLLGAGAGVVFMVSLLASGLSSSVVGTMAGQVVMQGFIRRRIPVWLRRVVTMIPAFAVIAWGVDATESLVASQVVLSLVLPVPVLALVWFCRDKALMGAHRLTRVGLGLALAATAIVLSLNLILLLQTAGVAIPGLG